MKILLEREFDERDSGLAFFQGLINIVIILFFTGMILAGVVLLVLAFFI